MIDITAHETAFQGRELEPLTAAGQEFLTECEAYGFFAEVGGWTTDMREFDDIFDAATDVGIVLGTAAGGVIVRANG